MALHMRMPKRGFKNLFSKNVKRYVAVRLDRIQAGDRLQRQARRTRPCIDDARA